MLDPVTTPLLILVLGKLADELLTVACKDFLKDKLKDLFGWLGEFDRRSDLALAYETALHDAFVACLEMLLTNVRACGYSDDELKPFAESLRKFAVDDEVASELLEAIKQPLDSRLPSPDVLSNRWRDLGCIELPGDLWTGTTLAFRRQATRLAFVNEPLREVLNAHNIERVRELLERDGGVRPDVSMDKYRRRMQSKYAAVDLANLMPSYAENPGLLVIRDVFVPQNSRQNPPVTELPKDLEVRLREKGIDEVDKLSDDERREIAEERRERLSAEYVNQSPQPVLDVITEDSNRLVMLIGEPGSGKTTLLRYLLLGLLAPPCDSAGHPLPWTKRFRDTAVFPLLIEMRDFHATRVRNESVNSFLDYVMYLGCTEQYFLDDQWLDARLKTGPSLVLFDGLDEIFERSEREKTMHEIAGFAQRYPHARIVITSRPVGYRNAILRQAGFRHFALQDLDGQQIEAFTKGWFTLTFPKQPDLAAQRIERVLLSIQRSKPILLLAGNPMLLTIMALLAREQELPRERAGFYESAVNVLCHHWDANRDLALPGTEYLGLEDKKELLRRVAIRMQTGKGGLAGNAIHETDLEQEVATWFSERFGHDRFEAIKQSRLMINQLRERNYILCLRGPRLYGFVHRTFLEFLTAAEYVNRFKDSQTMTVEELLLLYDSHCCDDDWREVLRLIAGQINEQFVGQVVEQLSARHSLVDWTTAKAVTTTTLAICCLSEVRNIARLDAVGSRLFDRVLKTFIPGNGGKQFHDTLLAAVQEIRERWPGVADANQRVLRQLGRIDDQRWATIYLPKVLACVAPDRGVQEQFAKSANSGLRWGAIEVLAANWRDEATRDLLGHVAIEDENFAPRRAAVLALASSWPDRTTRDLLTRHSIHDDHSSVRSAAVQALASGWADNETRELLSRNAIPDSHFQVRAVAIQALASNWPDAESRKLVSHHAIEDANEEVRGSAIRALALGWIDGETRSLLTRRAAEDGDSGVRIAALQNLASHWRDDEVREVIFQRSFRDEDDAVRDAALKALSLYWADEVTRQLLIERSAEDQADEVRGSALEALVSIWSDEATRELLSRHAADDSDGEVRVASLRLLASHWPDETTRQLLLKHVSGDDELDIRMRVIQMLAPHWPDAQTREVLRECIVRDPSIHVRGVAIRELASHWPDNSTRELLTQQIALDEENAPRLSALRTLASHWDDDVVLKLLVHCAVHDESDAIRGAALDAMGEYWGDEAARDFLTQRVVQDKSGDVRGAALEALASNWPDKETRDLLARRAVQDKNGASRSSSVRALASHWADDKTRELLIRRAVQDKSAGPRTTALRVLASHWADDETRELLKQRAVQDKHAEPRRAALGELASHWADDETRQLLKQRAVQDGDAAARSVALGALASHWADDETRELLKQRAIHDKKAAPRSTAFYHISRMHSRFGRFVTTRDCDGHFPYLDSRPPLSEEQITRAAKRVRIAPGAISNVLSELSAYVGWDVTNGAAASS